MLVSSTARCESVSRKSCGAVRCRVRDLSGVPTRAGAQRLGACGLDLSFERRERCGIRREVACARFGLRKKIVARRYASDAERSDRRGGWRRITRKNSRLRLRVHVRDVAHVLDDRRRRGRRRITSRDEKKAEDRHTFQERRGSTREHDARHCRRRARFGPPPCFRERASSCNKSSCSWSYCTDSSRSARGRRRSARRRRSDFR